MSDTQSHATLCMSLVNKERIMKIIEQRFDGPRVAGWYIGKRDANPADHDDWSLAMRILNPREFSETEVQAARTEWRQRYPAGVSQPKGWAREVDKTLAL